LPSPEVDRVRRDLLERPLRRELRLARLLAAEHRRLRLADHLDVAKRIVSRLAGEVEVVQPERLLEHGRVLVLGQREHGLAVVEHVVAPDLVGAVREPVRLLVGRGDEQQLRRVRGTTGEHDEIGGVRTRLAVVLHDDAADRLAAVGRLELHRLRVREQLDVRVLERRPDAEHVSVGLAVHRAREAVAVRAADAGAVRHVRLVQADAAGRVERRVPGGG
jgi:hypothetical protein